VAWSTLVSLCIHIVYMFVCVLFCFFFSSRRRHTRCYRDWSSDVCSSDLDHLSIARRRGVGVEHREEVGVLLIGVASPDVQQGLVLAWGKAPDEYRLVRGAARRGRHHEAQR